MSTPARCLFVASMLTLTAVGLTVPAQATGPVGAASSAYTATVRPCGVLDPMARPALSTATPTTFPVDGSVDDIETDGSRLYVLSNSRKEVRTFSLSGTLEESFAVDSKASSIAIDPAGSVYAIDAEYGVSKYSRKGSLLWQRSWYGLLPSVGTAVAGVRTPVGWRLAVSDRSSQELATTMTSDGAVDGSGPYGMTTAGRVSPTPDGGFLIADLGSVRRFTGDGRIAATIRAGSGQRGPSGAPAQIPGGSAIMTSQGQLLLASAYQGITVATQDGLFKGLVNDDVLGRLVESGHLLVLGNDVFYGSGGPWNASQRVARLPLASVLGLAVLSDTPRLGLGAGLVTDAKDQYFPAGTTPRVDAVFDASWATRSAGYLLRYTIRGGDQIRSGATGVPRELSVNTIATAGRVPLVLPPSRPGAFEVDAQLLRDGVAISSTCLHYGVGALGSADLSALPSGADAGGPGPARAVALAAALGTGAARVQLDWNVLLPDTAGPYNWSAYDEQYAAAAAEASRRGAVFIVQVGQGGKERAFVQDGTWSQRVRDVVAHYRGSVHNWEAWNEPNVTFGPPTAYVSAVLKPFYAAVKAADPGATVVGGSVVGLDLGYWSGIIEAGGAGAMDVAGIHPYTGHNRSYEEQGSPAAMTSLLRLLRTAAPEIRVWDTESSWWSNGPFDLWAQADYSVRATIWHKALGVERWAYFIPEGSWGNEGVSFSAIQVNDYIKPAALALLASDKLLQGRAFLRWVDTGQPHVYAATFGARPGGANTVMAVWTDDFTAPMRLTNGSSTTASLRRVDTYGAVSSLTVGRSGAPLLASGSVVFLVGAAAGDLAVRPTQAFGRNVALDASAVASSSHANLQPSKAVDGVADAANAGEWADTSSWASASGDVSPSLVLHLREPAVVNRLVVTSHSIGSVAPGLRTFTAEVRPNASASWTTVATVKDAFFERSHVLRFASRPVGEIRIKVTAVNYSGYNGGAPPLWWPIDAASMAQPGSTWAGPAIISEVEAYEPV